MKRSLRGRGSFGRLLLCALLAGATSAPVSADQYGYDELGNVETLSNPRGVRSYTYDEIQRLDTETGYSGNRDHAYDLNGNRTTDGASAPGTPTAATYTSNTNRIATLNGVAVTLDAAGQITNDGLNSYTWDDAGRLKTVSRGGQLRATYYYDHKHRRTRKVTTAAAPQGAKTLVYHYDDQDRLIAETTQTGAPVRSYLWADAHLLAQVEYTLNATTGLYTVSRELLFELDHLGTPRQARLTGGSAVWRWESDGYGNTLPNEDPDGNGQKTYVYLRFPGQYYDEESGLHYNWHRYYVPRLGRYLSSDPIGVEGGRNSYGYANGDPTSLVDPSGLDVCRTVLNLGVVTVLHCSAPPPIPPRPSDMTRKEESYYDRYCKNSDDPCQALKAAVSAAIFQARGKIREMLDDPMGLFRNAYSTPNPSVTGSRTTWQNHAKDVDGRIGSIWNMIYLGRKMGCDMSIETAEAMTLLTPGAPR